MRRRRGGFCYELNGLFALLLRRLGFEVTLLSARVFNNGAFGPEFDHLALRIDLAEPWLADVGFGDSFIEPLRLAEGEQVDPGRDRTYRMLRDSADWHLQERRGAGDWETVHAFGLQPRVLADFAGMCVWQQTAPESAFTQRRVCTLATPTGRVTLRDQRLIIQQGAQRNECELDGPAAVAEALSAHFSIHAL